MNMSLRFPVAGLLGALILAGCAVGPEYQRPEVATPAAFKEATLSPEAARQWQAAQPKDAVSRGKWWRIFNDPTLDALQAQAADANQDLKAAAARVRQARALVRSAQSDRLPDVAAGFGPNRRRTSGAAQGWPDDAAGGRQTLWRAQVGAAYEVDLFGRVAAGVDAATADAQQSAALY